MFFSQFKINKFKMFFSQFNWIQTSSFLKILKVDKIVNIIVNKIEDQDQ